MRRAAALILPLLVAACGTKGAPEPAPKETAIPKAVATGTQPVPESVDGAGTPNAERVATIGLLNKRNNLTQDLKIRPGEAQRVGNVVIKVDTCERTRPWESIEEEGAFVQVFIQERGSASRDLRWRKVFSGWLFRNSPSLNVVEHPVYDVWLKACAMSFPGEEAPGEQAKSGESASKAANASGSESGAGAAE